MVYGVTNRGRRAVVMFECCLYLYLLRILLNSSHSSSAVISFDFVYYYPAMFSFLLLCALRLFMVSRLCNLQLDVVRFVAWWTLINSSCCCFACRWFLCLSRPFLSFGCSAPTSAIMSSTS